MKKSLLFILATFSYFWCNGQSYYFSTDNSVPMEASAKRLPNAWAGGLNASQFSTIDVTGNGIEDLFVFDRSTSRVSIFLATRTDTGYTWIYRPEYENLFPRMESWALLRDYDGDGLKDIFTEASLASGGKGVRVFRNMGPVGGIPQFSLAAAELGTTSFSGSPIPLTIALGDLPDIVDIDGDGDLDVLVFEFSGGSVEFHQNMSMENTGNVHSLTFRKSSGCWGRFYSSHTCGEYELNVSCRPAEESPQSPIEPSGIKHSGTAITALDIDGNGVMDLLTSSVHCSILPLLYNGGTKESAVITSADTSFPRNSRKVDLFIFPAAFHEDVTFDGKKDLLVSVNSTVNENNNINFSQSNWLYVNQSNQLAPEFVFQSDNFLQAGMIDLGENANPSFADIDGDGDLDLLVGNYGKRYPDNRFYATLTLFENVGSNTSPAFKLINNDYLGFSSLGLTRLKPFFTDVNADNKIDLVFVSTANGASDIKYILNTAPAGAALQFDTQTIQRLPLNIGTEDSPALYDLDNDGIVDVLLAKQSGRMQYYRNTGSNAAPQYTLVKDNFGGIGDNLNKTNPKITLADLNSNNQPELIIGDRSGLLSIYEDITFNLNGNFQAQTQTLFDSLNQQFNEAMLSRFHLSPAAADLNRDGKPEIVLGTRAGGLIYLKNLASNPLHAIQPTKALPLIDMYPNPATGKVLITSLQQVKLQIESMTGQRLLNEVNLKPGQQQEIDISRLPPGLYIVQIQSQQGRRQAKKLIVY